ncbi:hypothetical protein [Streptomyces sp. NBC_00286]|uniref:hypothetical protein n=1 Tax=Streptomyces sp. NBC_00286 TaxID=2975701 RepID=UPI002E289CF2|nr:hypothetical protein [Streptomyces sp. NBC_00286]
MSSTKAVPSGPTPARAERRHESATTERTGSGTVPASVNVSWARRSTRTLSTGSDPGSKATHGSDNSASPEGDAAGDIVTLVTSADKRHDQARTGLGTGAPQARCLAH